MGCDIHVTVEKKVGDKWVMVHRLDYRDSAMKRNYERFSRIAGVRGESYIEPLGIPSDISDSTKLAIEEWDGDGHSHSYMDIEEAAQAWLETEHGHLDSFTKEYPIYHYFKIDPDRYKDEGSPYRVVFWFDN